MAKTITGCPLRAEMQTRLKNLEATKTAYRAKAAEADEARRLADRGEGHYRREYILREEATLIARELNEIMNVIPGRLLNGCSDHSLKAAWKRSLAVRTAKTGAAVKANSELEEGQRLLQKLEDELDRFFPNDGWKKSIDAEGIWKPILTRQFRENTLDDFQRQAASLQHNLRILQHVADEASRELEAAKTAVESARASLIWSPV